LEFAGSGIEAEHPQDVNVALASDAGAAVITNDDLVPPNRPGAGGKESAQRACGEFPHATFVAILWADLSQQPWRTRGRA